MINCLVVDDEPLAREALITHMNRLPDLNLVLECSSAIEAITALRNNKIDLIFLDIEMPELNGISFLQSLKNVPGIIFTTAYRNYAVEAFDLDVIDFLLKPVSFERFLKAIDKFYQRSVSKPLSINAEEPSKSINVKADRKTYKIDIKHIQYVESIKDYVKIVCNDETIVTHETISSYEKLLENEGFLRTHRSFLVAINRIISFDAETVYLKNKELPVSRTYKQSVLARLEK